MSKLFIRGLKVNTKVGVYDWEQQINQPLVFDLEFAVDSLRAAENDKLTQTIDYSAMITRITEMALGNEYGLLETLAEKIAECLQQEFKVTDLQLTITKPYPMAHVAGVGVVVRR